jgi:PAS domain S-box-containing protein
MFLFEENKIDFSNIHLAVLKNEIDAILNTAGTSAILLNKELEVQFFSKGIIDLYNISPSDLGKKISEIEGYFVECDVTYYANKILEQNVGYRGKITTSKGKHFMKRMAPFRTDEHGVAGIIVAFTDITDLENAQMALELSESRFRDMADVAVDYFFELAKDGTIVYVSPSMKESLGYTKEDVLGKKISDFMPPNEANYVIRHTIKHTKNSDTYPPVTHHVIKKDGSQIIVEARGKTIRDKNGNVIGFRAINRNITDRISTEKEQEHLNRLLEQKVSERTRELEEKQQQLEEAQRIGRVGSWVWNPSNNFVLWSDMMFQIFDIESNNNVTFEDFRKRIHPNDVDFVLQTEEKAIQSGEPDYEVQYRIIKKSGEVRYIDAAVQITRNEDGKVVKLIGTAQDVTPLKQQEEERRKLISDLMNQNKELQQFNYIVSHNLRSPVANMIGLSKLYKKGESSERNDKIVENILESAESMDTVIKDLSQILQLRGGITEERELVSISEVFSTVVKTINSQIQQLDAEVKTNFSAANQIFTVKSYLNSILYNLVSNALKYRHPKRRCLIEVESGKTEHYFYLQVTDNGIGFDIEKNKDKLFGLYKRFHAHIEGKGIGLYLVKVQAETLGGWVEVESEVGKGTTFTVFIANNS